MNDMHLHPMIGTPDGSTYLPVGSGDLWPAAAIRTCVIEAAGALVISKRAAGLPGWWVDQARCIVKAAAEGSFGDIKFLVFDLGTAAAGNEPRGESATLLLSEIANLILDAPIVTVAHARGSVGGADLELALACSMLIGDERAEFSFAADPVEAVATYALLAQKIGFVRAERLMEREDVLNAGQMRDLLLLKETTCSGPNQGGLEDFLLRQSRRHNSSAAMYRAQRIATPLISEIFGEPRRN